MFPASTFLSPSSSYHLNRIACTTLRIRDECSRKDSHGTSYEPRMMVGRHLSAREQGSRLDRGASQATRCFRSLVQYLMTRSSPIEGAEYGHRRHKTMCLRINHLFWEKSIFHAQQQQVCCPHANWTGRMRLLSDLGHYHCSRIWPCFFDRVPC